MAEKTAHDVSQDNPASRVGRKAETAAVNILAADLLVVDELLTIPSEQELKNLSPKQRNQYSKLEDLIGQLLAKKGMQRGDKISIDADDFKALSVIMAGLPAKMEAGGATADVLTTMKHLHGNKMSADFSVSQGMTALVISPLLRIFAKAASRSIRGRRRMENPPLHLFLPTQMANAVSLLTQAMQQRNYMLMPLQMHI